MINDPSNFLAELVKRAGGGWGLACLIAGGVIGAIVSMRQGMPTKGACIEYDVDAYLHCAKYGKEMDLVAWVNQGIFGLLVGCIAGVLIYQVYAHNKRSTPGTPPE